MKWIDLTHTLHENMPLYPGTDKPTFEAFGPKADDGFQITWYKLQSHMGTHMDAPTHYFRSGPSLDQLDVSAFIGNAVKIDVRHITQNIEISDLLPYEQAIRDTKFVMLWSGWDQYYGTENYLQNFPTLSVEAAQWLVTTGTTGLVMDMISADPVSSTEFEIHQILLSNNLLIVENLKNLCDLPRPICELFMLPLKYLNADGAPIRAVAR